MLDFRELAKDPENFRTRLESRGGEVDLSKIISLVEERARQTTGIQELRTRLNRANEQMQEFARAKNQAGLDGARHELRELSNQIKEGEAGVRAIEEELEVAMLYLPNLPHASAPVGRSAEDNPVVRTCGQPPALDFAPMPHDDLGAHLKALDIGRAAKLSGARFALLTGPLARLERALIQFMLDVHTREHEYTEVSPPYLVRRETMTGSGQLPKFENEAFLIADPELFLIPTAEVPLVGLHRDEVLDAAQLPLRYAAYTPCFRREAGSYGKDTRGIMRQHQFHKVELVILCRPEQSAEWLEKLTGHAETILKKLGLAYRIVELCTGDLGFASAKTYDVEVWIPSQNTYREISSCSNCGDFQARRSKIRYKDGKQTRFVHTLNGSGLAIGRTLLALMENYQTARRTIRVPEALVPYMDGVAEIGQK